MRDPSTYEKGRATSQAQETIAARPASSSARRITAAMRHYLAAAQYQELTRLAEPPPNDPPDPASTD